MKKNPYSLLFGKEPKQIISRSTQSIEIIESFSEEPVMQQIYMITGLRGSGKTVFMTEISEELRNNDEWVVVDLNSSSDLMNDLAAALASENPLAIIFKNAKINLSFFGFGLEVKGSVPVTNIQVAITKMLESLKKHGKKVLVCIDEVMSNEHMKTFAGAFQIFVRQELPIFLLMTGLYENINNLQNEKNLTFLYRAPKVELKPLNLGAITNNYMKNFDINEEQAVAMANLTRGYSFAFQVLGYFTWKCDGDYEAALPDFRLYLEDYVYEKVWSEMSEGDKRLAYGIAKSEDGKAKNIKDILDMRDNEYSPYRDRLIKKGIVVSKSHGYVSFTLPLFEQYVLRNYYD